MNLAGNLLSGIASSALAASAAILALVGLADVLLRWLVRRKVRRDEAAAAGAASAQRTMLQWLDQALRAAVPPVAMFLWINGGAAALSILLAGTTASPLGMGAIGWTRGIGTMACLLWLLVRIGRVAERAVDSFGGRTATTWDDALLRVAGRAARVLPPILALILGLETLTLPAGIEALVGTCLSLVLIGAIAFLLYQCVEAAETILLQRYRLDVRDNLEARTVYTQVVVLKKIATAVIVLFTVASMLMMFESVRQFGASILASAGIAGIILGFAAQRSIATLLAGLQIAITQPIRLDDVVIVENEWGRIEDITLTYVAVKIWDERRLIVPITYFIEQPFQNWTRRSAELLGTVFLHVDYRCPLDAVREELGRILRDSPYWDGRVNVLHVTGAGEHTLEIRALASAADASLAWDLRCEVREKLVQFLQREHPGSLPRVRAELQPALTGHEMI